MTQRPRVTIHNATSLDGRLDGFIPDLGLYYELASGFPQQAVLTGSATMLAAAASAGVDLSGEETAPATQAAAADPTLPWLVIVDSGGRLTRLDWLRTAPHWRDVLILCSATTPAAHLDRLNQGSVPHEVVGTSNVDLAGALDILADRYGVTAVRVDAGPMLNGALLRAGLVDEISVLIASYLVGSRTLRPLRLIEEVDDNDAWRLELTSVERLRDNHAWLRYTVRAESSS